MDSMVLARIWKATADDLAAKLDECEEKSKMLIDLTQREQNIILNALARETVNIRKRKWKASEKALSIVDVQRVMEKITTAIITENELDTKLEEAITTDVE